MNCLRQLIWSSKRGGRAMTGYQVFMFQFCAETLKGDTTCIGGWEITAG
ncbi:hypothetical protein PVAP13_1NG335138 [Panicum virgatum]|uniref:Uncharacterized protein n=1 Tax=Panicum virgatum TaxID=38727 RepID=A0A8T0X2N1_PANVG|nr:hypothetical protein PVAP13_1NG335138 [Panicum virgatum]